MTPLAKDMEVVEGGGAGLDMSYVVDFEVEIISCSISSIDSTPTDGDRDDGEGWSPHRPQSSSP